MNQFRQPGGQVRQPYSYSVLAPIDCLKILASLQRVLNDLCNTRLSRGRIIWSSPLLSVSLTGDTEKEILQGGIRGEGTGEEKNPIIQWRESVFLYKLFNTLC
jgi:hypothetical protein